MNRCAHLLKSGVRMRVRNADEGGWSEWWQEPGNQKEILELESMGWVEVRVGTGPYEGLLSFRLRPTT